MRREQHLPPVTCLRVAITQDAATGMWKLLCTILFDCMTHEKVACDTESPKADQLHVKDYQHITVNQLLIKCHIQPQYLTRTSNTQANSIPVTTADIERVEKRICMCLYKFNAANTNQAILKSEDTNVPAVVDVIMPHDRIGMVFHPDTSQSIAANFIMFIDTLNHQANYGSEQIHIQSIET